MTDLDRETGPDVSDTNDTQDRQEQSGDGRKSAHEQSSADPVRKMHEDAGTHDLKIDERIDLPARQRCMFGSRESHCGAPATAHVWVGDDCFTMGCDEHLWWWKAHPFKDSHHIGACCGLPGTFWLFTTPTEPGRCIVEGLSDLDASLTAVPMLEAVSP